MILQDDPKAHEETNHVDLSQIKLNPQQLNTQIEFQPLQKYTSLKLLRNVPRSSQAQSKT